MRKCFLCILLCLIFISGCGDKQITTSNQVDKSEQTVKVEQREVKEEANVLKQYFTPFIEFSYPSNFKEDTPLINASEQVIIAYTNKELFPNDKSKIINIMVNKSNGGNETTTADWSINWWLNNQLNNSNIVITCNPKDLGLGDIKYAEYVTYEKINSLDKVYCWSNNKSKNYIVFISGANSNKDNINKVAKIFERSIKFKQ